MRVDSNMAGHATAVAEMSTDDGWCAIAWGQYGSRRGQASAAVQYTGTKFSVETNMFTSTGKGHMASMAFVYAWGERWTLSECLKLTHVGYELPKKLDYCSSVRYRAGPETVSASFYSNSDIAVQYKSHINEKLTIGVELRTNTRNRTIQTSCIHRVILDDIVFKGESH